MSKSLAILLTAPGASAIAVVRLTGPLVPAFLRAHAAKPVPPGRCVHVNLTDGDTTIDDPVIVFTEDPTAADLNVHGGPWVVQSTLDLARRFGFEIVDRSTVLAPEAVDGDTPLQREILRHLPLARTKLAIRELLAQEQAWGRFDSMPAAERRRLAPEILADRSLYWLLNPPRVAIVGPPNAGKSTLANRLFAQERSITADLPGTTRDWVGEIANLDGLAVMLVDTPGLRETFDPIERRAIDGARTEIAAADLVLLVLDLARPMEEQRDLIDRFPSAIRVGNKSDLTTVAADLLRISAKTGAGLDELRRLIRDRFGVGRRPAQAKWWTEPQRLQLENLVKGPV